MVCGARFAARAGAVTCSVRCRVACSRGRPPVELMARDRWVRHRAKVPLTVAGLPASSTDERTWSSFADAAISVVGDGFGFVLNGDGVACVDLDGCLVNGRLAGWARDVMRACPSTYVEVSPSGRGLHVFGFAVVGRGRRVGPVEVYDRGRYICVTGRRFSRFPGTLADISDWVASL